MTNSDSSSVANLWNILQWHSTVNKEDTWSNTPLNWFQDSVVLQDSIVKTIQSRTVVQSLPSRKNFSASSTSGVTATHLYQSLEKDNKQSRNAPPLPEDLVQQSVDLKDCHSIDDLVEQIKAFEGCLLKKTARNTVVWDGNPASKILLIGEGPGEQEDLKGKPFVGPSGKLLDKMLSAIGLNRHNEDPEKSVLISNIIFWRPPANRVPSPVEVLQCSPFLNRLIEIVQPKIIMTVGGPATLNLLKEKTGIMKLRGQWKTLSVGGQNIPVLPTLHPAYLLRMPSGKKQAWHDFRELNRFLQKN